MRFTISISSLDNDAIINLNDSQNEVSAEILSYGALLNKFTITNANKEPFNIKETFIDVADARNRLATWFNGARLSPFVCRLNLGEYKIDNKEYKIEKFYMGRHAIHGLLFDADYKVVHTNADEEAASVTLLYSYQATDKGYPFAFDSYITYTLTENNHLRISSDIINKSDIAIPFNEGWHPYFNLPGNSNDWDLQINSTISYEFNEEMIPTGNTIEDKRFLQHQQIGDTHLDNCYQITDYSNPSCILGNSEYSLSIYLQPSMPFLQVFTPDHRNSIAIESLSSIPNSFNNGIGLVWIKPEETKTFETVYVLERK